MAGASGAADRPAADATADLVTKAAHGATEQARMLVVLRERQIEMGLGLIIVSHDLAVVRKVAGRIVVLDGGRVVEEGPSYRVATNPTSATARRLLAPDTGAAR